MAPTDVLQTDIGQQFADKWRGYRDDPVGFQEDILGIQLYEAQKQIARSVAANDETAVQACHSSGKSFEAAALALWWLYTRCPSTVITTATTWEHVENVLWREINRMYNGIPPNLQLGKCLSVELDIAPDWYAIGLNARKPESFQGHHNLSMLGIIDEASGVEEMIFRGMESMLSGGETRLLLISNPLRAVGTFYDACNRPELGFHPIKIGYKDTPNWTGEESNAPLISKKYVERRAIQFGKDSYEYVTRCLGQFYAERETVVLVPMGWVEAAKERVPGEDHLLKDSFGQELQIGLDVGRDLGGDRSIMAWRSGLVFLGIEDVSQKDSGQLRLYVQQRSAELANEYRMPTVIAVDEIGVGAGVVDNWDEKTVPCVGIAVSKASEEERFMLLRDEHYWRLREMLRPGADREHMVWAVTAEHGIAANRCANQLAAIQHERDTRGRPKIESKDKMRERNMPSPDEAEALMLAFAPVRTRPAMQKWGSYRGKTRESPI